MTWGPRHDSLPGSAVKDSPHNVYYETAREYNQVVAEFLTELKLMPPLQGNHAHP